MYMFKSYFVRWGSLAYAEEKERQYFAQAVFSILQIAESTVEFTWY